VLEIENGGLGICSVANGRVEIKLGTERFSVCENGMLRVRGGEKCRISNMGTAESIVHITTVQ
jgi:hypothetical protein